MLYFSVLLPLLAVTAYAAPTSTSTSSSSKTTSIISTSTTSLASKTTSVVPVVNVASSSSTSTSGGYSCVAQPTGVGIGPSTDTAAAFVKYTVFHGDAISAALPSGYLISFAASNAAVQQNTDFMTYYLLPSYNTQTCADYCTNTYGCQAWNIFFERAPSVNPAVGCPNPPSVTYVKCSLFSQTVASSQLATNAGQWRGPYSGANVTQNFQVVIAGSNAFNKQ